MRLLSLLACAAMLAIPITAFADNGNAGPTMSFFSGGYGGHADWLATSDQPPGDTDNQAIRLLTVNDAAGGYAKGYAGILFHHVTGIQAEEFPDSEFWNKTPDFYPFEPYTEGSPRLVVAFQTVAGKFDGYADLREATRFNGWEEVSDVTDYPNSGWDVMNTPMTNPCYPFRYSLPWNAVQTCFAGDTTLSVYLTTDAYGIYHLIDDITVDGKHFSGASDNSNGINDPAGPDLSVLSLLPPLGILPAASS